MDLAHLMEYVMLVHQGLSHKFSICTSTADNLQQAVGEARPAWQLIQTRGLQRSIPVPHAEENAARDEAVHGQSGAADGQGGADGQGSSSYHVRKPQGKSGGSPRDTAAVDGPVGGGAARFKFPQGPSWEGEGPPPKSAATLPNFRSNESRDAVLNQRHYEDRIKKQWRQQRDSSSRGQRGAEWQGAGYLKGPEAAATPSTSSNRVVAEAKAAHRPPGKAGLSIPDQSIFQSPLREPLGAILTFQELKVARMITTNLHSCRSLEALDEVVRRHFHNDFNEANVLAALNVMAKVRKGFLKGGMTVPQ